MYDMASVTYKRSSAPDLEFIYNSRTGIRVFSKSQNHDVSYITIPLRAKGVITECITRFLQSNNYI